MAAATISIELDPGAAKAYAEAPEEQRRKLQLLCNLWLQGRYPPRPIDVIMKEIGERAAANGMTQEILDEILNDDSA